LKGYQQLNELIKTINYNISVKEAVEKMDNNSDVKVVDCRSKKEVIDNGYLRNSYGVYMNTSIA